MKSGPGWLACVSRFNNNYKINCNVCNSNKNIWSTTIKYFTNKTRYSAEPIVSILQLLQNTQGHQKQISCLASLLFKISAG